MMPRPISAASPQRNRQSGKDGIHCFIAQPLRVMSRIKVDYLDSYLSLSSEPLQYKRSLERPQDYVKDSDGTPGSQDLR